MGKRIDNTTCHCLKMRRSAENVVRFYDGVLAPSGVTARQYSLLFQIMGHEGCSVRELSQYTALDRSTLTRSLRPLMKAGLIQDGKEVGTRDSRLALTKKGRTVCEQAGCLWEQAQRAYEERVGAEQVKRLEHALEALQEL